MKSPVSLFDTGDFACKAFFKKCKDVTTVLLELIFLNFVVRTFELVRRVDHGMPILDTFENSNVGLAVFTDVGSDEFVIGDVTDAGDLFIRKNHRLCRKLYDKIVEIYVLTNFNLFHSKHLTIQGK